LSQKEKQSVKLSKLVGVDEKLFANRKPSKELESMRKEWDIEFDKRIL